VFKGLPTWADAAKTLGHIWDDCCESAAYEGVWLPSLDFERNKKPQLRELRPWSVRCPR
jgi:hypothetical protein